MLFLKRVIKHVFLISFFVSFQKVRIFALCFS
jgi:hypothetical protein